MESLLGFHPPHFSEEAAWLPGWLQPSTLREASNQALQCPSGQGLEEIGCYQQNISIRENENLADNGSCKNFHLFLSGEDNSTMNFPSSSSHHEVQYHLHLSSFEESQNLSNPVSSKSQPEKIEPNQPLIIHHPDSKVTPEEITHEQNNNPSPQKGNLGISSQEPKGPNGKTHKPNPKSRKLDISDAVELAVAASEALIIHEAVKDEPSTQLSSPLSVLEAAIRVKNARLEEVNESFGFDDSNEVDFLSDLDELTMADAYEDVGLTFNLSGYESLSYVKDSYGGLEADLGSISSKQEMLLNKGFVLDSIEAGIHKEDVAYAALDIENADLGCDADPIFSCSVEQADICLKKVGLQRDGELTSCQTILRTCPGSRASGCHEREDKMTNSIPNRFQSRWFGGWTGKNEVAVTSNNNKRSIPEVFPNETSSLSESAPTMNSVAIQKHDNSVSQSSIAPKDTPNKPSNNDNLLSEDVNISQSSLPPKDTHNKTANNGNSPSEDDTAIAELIASPMDLLCSVVPCSLTSNPLPPTHHNAMSPQRVDFHNKTKPKLGVFRKVSSLKTYSMLSYSHYDPYLDNQPSKTPILNFQDDIDTHNPTDHNEKKTNSPLTIDREDDPIIPEKNPELDFKKVKPNIKDCLVPRRKRVRFSEPEICHVKKPKTRVKKHNKMLFQDLKFLITGFSVKKHKEIKNLIQKNGGIVLEDIPSPTSRRKRCERSPVILCPKRLLTTKFLYGCAVNASILKLKWLFDSVNEGSILPPKKYTILKEHGASCGMIVGQAVNRGGLIFENLAVMLHGKKDFCMKMAGVVRHGGGLVFKTFRWLVKRVESNGELVGAIVVEGENGISRQLKQCAVEKDIAVVSFDWIVKSLYAGKLVASPEFKGLSGVVASKVPLDLSEEI